MFVRLDHVASFIVNTNHGISVQFKLSGDSTLFSLVFYRKGQVPEYHPDLTREQADELIAQLFN